MPSASGTRVAWIGLGAMGSRMAHRLVDGHSLTVWNRTPARAEALRVAGARVAGTPAEAVRHAEVVVVLLADPAALAEVSEGVGGFAAAVEPGATVIDMSTAGPAAVDRLRAAVPAGVAVLDAPVLGSLAEAAAGTLTLLVGGADEAVARVRPVLSALGEPVHLGPSGSGAAAKLVANHTLLATVAVLGEALALADGLDLPREVAWRVLGHTPLAAQADRRRPAIESDTFPPRFALAMAGKDTDLVAVAADTAGVDLRLARAVRHWFSDAVAAGRGDQDYTAVLAHILAARHRPASGAGAERRP